jgi:hypothetical protein
MRSGTIKYNNINKNWIPLILMWPFGAMVRSFVHYKLTASKNYFWLYCIFFGFVFIYEDPKTGEFGQDSARYANDLLEYHKNETTFLTFWKGLYSEDGGNIDVYQPLLTWIISNFTNDPRILFMFFGGVFGFFYSRNLWMVYDKIESRAKPLLFLLMFYLALINPIWNINGVRMWTAVHVFLYGLMNRLFSKSVKGYIWLCLAPIFHFSLTIPVLLSFIFSFVRQKYNLLFYLYIFSAFISEVDLGFVQDKLSQTLPSIYQPRVQGYFNDEYVEKFQNDADFATVHVKLAGIVSVWLVYVVVFLLYINRKRWINSNNSAYNLFIMGLILGIFANLARNAPSGGRFMIISNFIFCASMILVVSNGFKKIRWLKTNVLLKIMLIYLILFGVRVGLEFTGLFNFIGNPFVALVVYDQKPLISFVKDLFII